MEKQNNDKKRLILVASLSALFTVTVIIWGISDYLNNNKTEGISAITIVLILAIFGFNAIRDKYASLEKGEPFKDERSIKLQTKAAAYAFCIGIYWLLGLSMIIDQYKLSIPASSVPGVGIVGMAVIFGLAHWYFNKKGE